jgi:broad specificity phosphatase PhoE
MLPDNSTLSFERSAMQIVLMRHGEPETNLSNMLRLKCSANELKSIIRTYNDCGLNKQNAPSSGALHVTNYCKSIVCSDLRRSIESARILAAHKIDLVDPIFRESDLPHANWRYPKLKLITWFFFFRTIWFLGYSMNGEPISNAQQRAKIAFLKLKEIAFEYGSVMLIGHGIINRLLARNLRSNGWKGPKNPGSNYWEYGVYISKR